MRPATLPPVEAFARGEAQCTDRYRAGKRLWNAADDVLFVARYPHESTSTTARELRRSVPALYGRARLLGLTKSADYAASPAACRLRRGDNVGAAFRFKKGHVPANKGLRRPGWAPGRMRESQFKKGERRGVATLLYKPIGTERIKDGYLERKVNDDLPLQRRWRAKNRERVREYFREYAREHPELRTYRAAYYRKNRDSILAKQREYLKTTKERRSAYQKAYREKNREALSEQRRRRRLQNLEEVLQRERATRTRNRDKKRARDADYRKRKPDIYRASIAKAKAKKPELYREIDANRSLRRRARQKAIPTEKVRLGDVYARDQNRCHLCGEEVGRESRSVDHLIPILRGGAHAFWNLATAHKRCNQRRGVTALFHPETKERAELYLRGRAR